MARPSSADRAKRLLALIRILADHGELSVAEVAADLGIDEDTAEADLELLSCCGVSQIDPYALVPVFVEDGVVQVFGELPALSEPVRLSAAEASALSAALQAAGMSASEPLPRKLIAAAAAPEISAEDLERTLRADAAPGGSFVFEPLTLAVEERRVVTIEYRAYGRLGETKRTIEPISLMQELGAWYVRAYVRETDDVRTFRLDRIRDARLTRETFEPRSAEAPAPESALPTAGLPVATVRLAECETFSEREWPGGRVVSTEDGVTIEVPYAGTAWIARQVVARMGAAEVAAPAEVREAVAVLAREELARLG